MPQFPPDRVERAAELLRTGGHQVEVVDILQRDTLAPTGPAWVRMRSVILALIQFEILPGRTMADALNWLKTEAPIYDRDSIGSYLQACQETELERQRLALQGRPVAGYHLTDHEGLLAWARELEVIAGLRPVTEDDLVQIAADEATAPGWPPGWKFSERRS